MNASLLCCFVQLADRSFIITGIFIHRHRLYGTTRLTRGFLYTIIPESVSINALRGLFWGDYASVTALVPAGSTEMGRNGCKQMQIAERERKIPHDLQIPWKSWGFSRFDDHRLTKKETAFRLSLWCARRDLKASHALQPAIHRLAETGADVVLGDLPTTKCRKTAIASFATSGTQPISQTRPYTITGCLASI